MTTMVQRKIGRAFPKGPLYGAFALIGFSLLATLFGRVTDIGTIRNPTTRPIDMRDIAFRESARGEITVVDAISGEVLKVIAPGEGGFIPGSLRGLNQDRKVRNAAPTEPYRLIKWDDGRLTLSDTATGQRIMLDAFGPTNSGAYGKLLERRGGKP
jgi:putative photosynthetic complex assembly protein